MKKQHVIIAAVFLMLASCSQNSKYAQEDKSESISDLRIEEDIQSEAASAAVSGEANSKESQNSPAQDYTSSAAAIEGKAFGNRRFVRTSEMKFKVDDVISSTYRVEEIAVQSGGFVVKSEIRNTAEHFNTIKISADSAKLVTYYTLESLLQFRVPSYALDSALKAIAPLVGKMDYRIVEAKEMSLSLLANKLSQQREAGYSKRVENAVDNRKAKLDDVVDAEGNRKESQRSADEAYLANLSLEDRIEFSTVSIRMYQKEVSKTEYIAIAKEDVQYKPPFTERLINAFGFGWSMLCGLILFLANLWVFILLIIVAFVAYRKYKKRKTN